MAEQISEVGYLAGLCGHDGTNWLKALIDVAGHLQVDLVDSGGASLGDLETLLTEIQARIGDEISPATGSTNRLLTTLTNTLVLRATTPYLYNVTMTTASTEYSQALASNCKKFTVKCRGEYDMNLCFTAEGSGTTYITIPSGQCYWEDNIRDVAITLYLQCATAAQVAEIVAWN